MANGIMKKYRFTATCSDNGLNKNTMNNKHCK